MTDSHVGGRRFRPGFWASACTLAALIALLGLGVWQLERLAWKQAMIAERQARLGAPPMALPDPVEDPDVLEFRHVNLTGRYLLGRTLTLASRIHKGQVGSHVVTPFVLDDGRGILVDRGWVPADLRAPVSQPEGSVTLDAILRSGGWKGRAFLRPDNDPQGNVWLWFDLPAMATQAGLDNPVTALYAQIVGQAPPEGLPIPAEPQVDLRNDHLQYALTWFALAVALVVIYVIFGLRRAGPGEETP